MSRKYLSTEDRLRRLSRPTVSGCLEWLGPVEPNGYAKLMIRVNGKSRSAYAHRVSFVTFKGAIPNGLHVHHSCGNRKCIAPDHLHAVTRRENNLSSNTVAAINAAKDRCPKGHPYDESNTRYYRRMRFCRRCKRDRDALYRAERKAGIAPRGRKTAERSRLLREAIIGRDKSTCYLCSRHLQLHEVTLDHVIPSAKGGAHTAANLRVACRKCNSGKGARTEPVTRCKRGHLYDERNSGTNKAGHRFCRACDNERTRRNRLHSK